jgi:hypothetical protein
MIPGRTEDDKVLEREFAGAVRVHLHQLGFQLIAAQVDFESKS